MYIPQVTADRIKKIASEKGLTLSQLNEKCGISVNVISQSAKSKEGMKARNLFAIAEALECSVDYLLGRTDSPEPDKVQLSDSGQNEIKKAPANAEGDKNKLKKATVEQWVNTISQLSLDNQIRLMTYLELLVAEQVLDGQADK